MSLFEGTLNSVQQCTNGKMQYNKGFVNAQQLHITAHGYSLSMS